MTTAVQEPHDLQRSRPRAARQLGPRVAAAVLIAAFVTTAGWGAYLYIHRYWVYRGSPPPVTPKGVPSGTVRSVVVRSEALHHRRSYRGSGSPWRTTGCGAHRRMRATCTRSRATRPGELRALQRYVPYGRGLSLDAMRRLDDEPNGVSDVLVAAALAHAREQGCTEVSLNFAGFAHLMPAAELEHRSQRLARWALRRLHGRFQLERLVRFAQKFGPEWRPRYLVYTRRARLPLTALRVLQSERYIRPPHARRRRDAWRRA